jgi:hypothetical protein
VISNEYITALADANEAMDSFTERTRSYLTIAAVDAARWSADIASSIGSAWRGLGPGLEQLRQARRDASVDAALSRTSDLLGSGSGTASFSLDRRGAAGAVNRAAAADAAKANKIKQAARVARVELDAVDRRIDAAATNFQGVAQRVTSEAASPLEALSVNLEALQPTITATIDRATEGFRRMEGLAAQVSENLAQGIVYGKGLGDALVNSFKAAGAQAAAGGIFKLIQALAGGDSFSSSIGAAITAAGASFGGARANGGPVSPGRAYLVGERGPEILFPSMSGVIAANGKGMGRQTVDVNVTASPELVVTSVVAGQRGGARAAAEVLRQATRPRLGGSWGV